MSIIVGDKEFRTLSDEFFVNNGKKVIGAYLGDGTKVYPEDEYTYSVTLYGSKVVTTSSEYYDENGDTVKYNSTSTIDVELTVEADFEIWVGFWPNLSTDILTVMPLPRRDSVGKKASISASATVSADASVSLPPAKSFTKYSWGGIMLTYDAPGSYAPGQHERTNEVEASVLEDSAYYLHFGEVQLLDISMRDPRDESVNALHVANQDDDIVGSAWRSMCLYVGFPVSWLRQEIRGGVVVDERRVTASSRTVSANVYFQRYVWNRRPGDE